MCDEFAGHILQQLVRNGQSLSCTSRTDTQELKKVNGKQNFFLKGSGKIQKPFFSWTEALTGFLLLRSLSIRKDILIVSAVGTMMSA